MENNANEKLETVDMNEKLKILLGNRKTKQNKRKKMAEIATGKWKFDSH